jgi:hypothetical protein
MITFEAPKRLVRRVFLHCSAWDDPMAGQELVAEIRRWHTSPSDSDPSKPWSDIGYHYVIDAMGEVMTGRSLETTPAAQRGNNRSTIAICVHGLGFHWEWHQGAQAASVIDFCGEINMVYQGMIAFWAHNEVDSKKTCPVFNHKALLDLDRWRRMP